MVPYSVLSPKSRGSRGKEAKLESSSSQSQQLVVWLSADWLYKVGRWRWKGGVLKKKRGIYSAKVNWVSAIAAFDLLPDSGHSAVAPRRGWPVYALHPQSGNCNQGQLERQAEGADLHSWMISWFPRTLAWRLLEKHSDFLGYKKKLLALLLYKLGSDNNECYAHTSIFP